MFLRRLAVCMMILVNGCTYAATHTPPCATVAKLDSEYQDTISLSNWDGLPVSLRTTMRTRFVRCVDEGNSVCIVGYYRINNGRNPIRKPRMWVSKDLTSPLDAVFDVHQKLVIAALQTAIGSSAQNRAVCVLGKNLDFVASPWYVNMSVVEHGKIVGTKDVTDYGAFTTAMTPDSLRREMRDAYRTGIRKFDKAHPIDEPQKSIHSGNKRMSLFDFVCLHLAKSGHPNPQCPRIYDKIR